MYESVLPSMTRRRQSGATTSEYLVLVAVLILGLIAGLRGFKDSAEESLAVEGGDFIAVAQGEFPERGEGEAGAHYAAQPVGYGAAIGAIEGGEEARGERGVLAQVSGGGDPFDHPPETQPPRSDDPGLFSNTSLGEDDPEQTPLVRVFSTSHGADPGDCTSIEHRGLQNEVNRACKRERKCRGTDSCAVLAQRTGFNLECANARKVINNLCFKGGDSGHRDAVRDATNGVAKCQRFYAQKCQEPEPEPEPEPVPAPKPVELPTTEITITGVLIGVGLFLWHVPARLFLPRNLIPI